MSINSASQRNVKYFGIAIITVIILGIILLFNSVYTVDEAEQAIIFQFKEPIGNTIKEPGLHFKVPFIQKAQLFDKRLQSWDGDPNQIPYSEEQYIFVDTTARWRIADPLLFHQRVTDIDGATRRLNDILDSVVRDRISSTELTDIVRSKDWQVSKEDFDPPTGAAENEEKALLEDVEIGREELVRSILETAQKEVPDFGVELVDIRIKRLNYVKNVQKQVFRRMISERQRMAEQHRSEGHGRGAEIDGETEKLLAEIRSKAKREAEVIRGEADAKATSIYSEAYGSDPEFYAFLRTMESYETTMNSGISLVLNSDSAYFRYLSQHFANFNDMTTEELELQEIE